MAGETALARQLKKLAVPQTSLLVQTNIRKSLLFDHRYAATLDRDVIYAHGISGLEKLEEINSQFSSYNQNLFSSSYTDFERSVQTSSINKKLDEKLVEFLRLVSPYFLNAASAQALEWLVYRYHIHLYNTDALIASALPYFNTPHFVRVVQLLTLDDEKSRWAWLKPVQKKGYPIEYPVILNRFISDGGFRKFVCDLAPNVLKVYNDNPLCATPVIAFSMQITYNAIGKLTTLNDKWIAFLLPYIINGIESKVNKYAAASYLVLSAIVTKVNLDEKLIKTLLVKIFESVTDENFSNALRLLLIIFQHQPIKNLDRQILLLLLSNHLFLGNLACFAEYDCNSLAKALLKQCIALFFEQYSSESTPTKKSFDIRSICRALVSERCLSQQLGTFYLNILFKKWLEYTGGKNTNKKLFKSVKLLVTELETKYPDSFDKVINKYSNKKESSRLRNLINASVCGVKNAILPSSFATLTLGLNHNNANIRANSVKFLLEKYKSEDVKDLDFFKSEISLKFVDDSSCVVGALLSQPDIIFKYVDRKTILNGLGNILLKRVSKKGDLLWNEVQLTAIDIICKYFIDDEYSLEVFVTLLPFIFPLKKSYVKGYMKIANSEYGAKLTNDQIIGVNYTTLFAIKNYVSTLAIPQKSLFLAFLANKCSETSSYSLCIIYILAMTYAIVSEKTIEEVSTWTEQLLHFLKKLLSQPSLSFKTFTVNNSDDNIIEDIYISLSKNYFPTNVIFSALYCVVSEIRLKIKYSDLWLQSDESIQFLSFKTLLYLFEFCIQKLNCQNPTLTENFQIIFSKFISHQFKNISCLFYFLSFLWANTFKLSSLNAQLTSLRTAQTFCQSSNHDMSWFFENDVLCFNLLKAISSPAEIIRENALNLLSSLLKCSESSESPLKFLCCEVKKYEEEILVSFNECYSAIGKWLEIGVIKNSEKATRSVLEKCKALLLSDQTTLSVKYEIALYLKDINSIDILLSYVPVIKKFLNYFKQVSELPDELSLTIVETMLKKFTPEVASSLNKKCIDVLFECLAFKQDHLTERNVQLFALSILSKSFFKEINLVSVKKKLLETLLDLCVTSTSSVGMIAKKVLHKLTVYAHLVLEDFSESDSTPHKVATLKEAKKSNKAVKEACNSFDTIMWKKLVLLLEILQDKANVENIELLIPELFAILNKTLNTDSQSSVEHIRQLILSSIYNCCQQSGGSGLNESQFQVELIVQCIRLSRNPKTHQQSLLLLNLAATLFPQHVLHNVMSIFTFMGSSLIRQDDSYSFQVISQTIETIVPSLLQASTYQEDADTVQIVSEVIRVFVDSLTDIPCHRQMPLFQKLINTLDPSQFLWIPLGQICDQYATVFSDMLSDNNKDRKVSPTLEFAINLHKNFSPVVQIETCINLLEFLTQLPDKKENVSLEAREIKEPFNVASHTNQQLQIYKYNVLSYINEWLSSQTFIMQVSELDTTAQNSLEKKYVLLLEKALLYLQHQKNFNPEKSMYNERNIIPLLIDLVCHVNCLLPSHLFIKVLRTLLEHSEVAIKNKAVEILNSKLEQQHHHLSKVENHKYLLKLLRPLLKLITNYSESDSEDKKDHISQQTALYSLHLLTKIIGSTYPTKFYKVLNVTVQILISSQNQELSVNALLCLAQLCCSLNVEVLPQLNKFMPVIIDLLTDNKILDVNDNLVLGVITVLLSLIKNLGSFLSSYLQSIVSGVCLLSAKYKEASKNDVHEKFITLQMLLAKDIPLRVLLTTMEDSYSSLQIICPNAVISLAQILNDKLNNCTYDEIKACLAQLEKFSISLLGFRQTQVKSLQSTFESICAVESVIVNALKTFVMKLSVSIFEKFFKKIFQWVFDTEDDDIHQWRIFTFYNLTSQLSDCLKNLFVVVAKCFLKNAASTLELYNISKKDCEITTENLPVASIILNNILDTLNNCFIYDDVHLLDKENFELLLHPLIDQLENYNDSNQEVFQERVETHLSQCIAHFMNSVSDNSLWKKSNYQILLKTRHDSAAVRFAAIQVIREVVKVMGDSYLVLLPESIPFLAEVMEDESSEVEQECQSVIIEMEKVLGEPIRKYF